MADLAKAPTRPQLIAAIGTLDRAAESPRGHVLSSFERGQLRGALAALRKLAEYTPDDRHLQSVPGDGT